MPGILSGRLAGGGQPKPASAQIQNAVIYCRVSSKEQIEGTSLETQEAACREYAKTHNINILRTFIERGESAKVADRTQLIELIDFCRTSKVKAQGLLVWKLDRFARNVGDHFNIKATLSKYGVRVVSVTEPIDGNPEGKLMEAILAGFAQFDNDIRAARTVQGMRKRIQDGIFPWKAPLGYRSASREGPKKTSPDQPNQPLFGLLQKAWKEFGTGAYTKADILRMMTSWGIRTERGLRMTAQSLDNFFRNPYYAGIIVDPWSGEEHTGNHVPMVGQDQFRRVQMIIEKRGNSNPHRTERIEFPLRGLARCRSCRHYLTGGFSRGRSRAYPYYHCGNRQCSSKPNYPTQAAHREFGTFLETIGPKQELITILNARIVDASEKRRLQSEKWKERKMTEVRRLDSESQELIRMKAQGLISDEEFSSFRERVLRRKMDLTEGPESKQREPKIVRAALEEIRLPLTRLRATWESIPLGFHRRFNHMVLPCGFVMGEYGTAELGPLFRVLDASGQYNSHEVPLEGETLNQICEAIEAFADFFREIDDYKKAA